MEEDKGYDLPVTWDTKAIVQLSTIRKLDRDIRAGLPSGVKMPRNILMTIQKSMIPAFRELPGFVPAECYRARTPAPGEIGQVERMSFKVEA